MDNNRYGGHIEATPGICGGRPRVEGHRITVQDIAVWSDLMGMSPDEIASEYSLSLGQVHAALAYYFDHVQEIQERIRKDDAFAEEVRRRTPSLLKQRLRKQKSGAKR
ncbi:MAG: hypothetical protein BWX88_04980 [Planctomycetes bacterium ADurb.Bin126]|nr:MAG: hypothetical protein BWX88_04980 [Planctomycetes bacterium ADurb.Bin126]HOD81044.1 DUF433 domain-containing protein [Phycisphaerae bacterium]HQL75664.1 DUF433 domain-containing protein [Phycisphaerae bacterium]